MRARTLAGAIADQLRRDILAGTYPPASQLRQDAVANAFNVSRIPVREALLQLEAEGLVRIEPHKGAVVTPLSWEEVEDVFALRVLLEPRLLSASLPNLRADDLDEMDRIQDAFAAAVTTGDAGQWGTLNAALHLAMYRRAAQPRTLAIVTTLLQTSERYTRLQLATPEAWARADREHAALIACCRSGDTAGAVRLLDHHIASVCDDLRRLAMRKTINTGGNQG
ncbi:MAG: GntR family transcriptional regulator [Beijerinckiaceae bacterium]